MRGDEARGRRERKPGEGASGEGGRGAGKKKVGWRLSRSSLASRPKREGKARWVEGGPAPPPLAAMEGSESGIGGGAPRFPEADVDRGGGIGDGHREGGGRESAPPKPPPPPIAFSLKNGGREGHTAQKAQP